MKPQCQPNCDQKNWKDAKPKGGLIRTTCKQCGRWIGNRPAKNDKQENGRE